MRLYLDAAAFNITRIPLLFPLLYFHLAVVLDARSRLPLAAGVFLFEPSAKSMAALLEQAVRTHGRPRHLVTDQGPQFTAEEFRDLVKRLGIKPRFGAVGETHSLGLIDRFFRTIKECLGLRLVRPWNFQDFRRRLDVALVHYAYCRPHSSLGGRVPIEAYYGIQGHLPTPLKPPRGRAHESGPAVPYVIAFLDPENRTFPILIPKAA